MKKILCVLAMLASLKVFGQDTNSINADFQLLAQKIQAKIAAGKTNSTDLKMELAEFDNLIAEENGAKTEEAAHMAYMKAMLFIEILGQHQEGLQMLEQVKSDFPNTPTGKLAEQTAAEIEQDDAAKKIRDALVVGVHVPDFAETDMDGKPISLAGFRGKVVLIDFWATWCPPCYAGLPRLIEIYKKYHPEGFEILGVSLDSDRRNLESFIKQNDGMSWREYFDGRSWYSEMATRFGVDEVPSSLLIGPDGKLLGKSLKGDALERAVATALAKR